MNISVFVCFSKRTLEKYSSSHYRLYLERYRLHDCIRFHYGLCCGGRLQVAFMSCDADQTKMVSCETNKENNNNNKTTTKTTTNITAAWSPGFPSFLERGAHGVVGLSPPNRRAPRSTFRQRNACNGAWLRSRHHAVLVV